RGFFKRSLEWFWGAEPEGDAESAPARALEYERRARVAAELARRALEPPEPFADGSPDALAAGLYHQSILWGLRSLGERHSVAGQSGNGHAAVLPTTGSASKAAPPDDDGRDVGGADGDESQSAPSSEPGSSATKPDAPSTPAVASRPSMGDLARLGFGELWLVAAPDKLLLQANLTQAEIDEAKQQMSGCSFADYADLPADDQLRWARKLRVVAEGLLYGIEVSSGRYSPPWLSRALRVGLLLLLILGVGWSAIAVREWMIELDNIARGKPWTTSSAFATAACRSPAQKCAESPSFFFHTTEESQPWVELDLGTIQRLSSVKVKNREDCCSDRAVPLLLEVSNDGKQWKQLARKNDVFTTWHAEFPSAEARWVRLRLARRGMLHLAGFDVYK
ncbi:MAG TPA: discoidin domain-containing protein, partial [Polyangiaceae bacterium]|nr:discoidin domain-containing protein [Polyangiaceae bacterium]